MPSTRSLIVAHESLFLNSGEHSLYIDRSSTGEAWTPSLVAAAYLYTNMWWQQHQTILWLRASQSRRHRWESQCVAKSFNANISVGRSNCLLHIYVYVICTYVVIATNKPYSFCVSFFTVVYSKIVLKCTINVWEMCLIYQRDVLLQLENWKLKTHTRAVAVSFSISLHLHTHTRRGSTAR